MMTMVGSVTLQAILNCFEGIFPKQKPLEGHLQHLKLKTNCKKIILDQVGSVVFRNLGEEKWKG